MRDSKHLDAEVCHGGAIAALLAVRQHGQLLSVLLARVKRVQPHAQLPDEQGRVRAQPPCVLAGLVLEQIEQQERVRVVQWDVDLPELPCA